MNEYPKRLIEVDLPIARISAHARREKSIRHGHISTLHIWWARRLLAACRAVICAALWPDPVDLTTWAERGDPRKDEVPAGGGTITIRPGRFLDEARRLMTLWAQKRLSKASQESYARLVAFQKDPKRLDDPEELRRVLLDFIADFANWDNSTDKDYLDTARALTQAAHEALGGEPGTRPLVVDPFAGGGSIPLEALRVGADAFASDLNPVAVLLNKVVLEYIPKYGQRLADEVRKWGQWVENQVRSSLSSYYPGGDEDETPLAYLWGRVVRCDGPACGVRIPLVRQPVWRRRGEDSLGLSFIYSSGSDLAECHLLHGQEVRTAKGTCSGFKATCPRPECQYTTPKKRVQAQLAEQCGGADQAQLLAVFVDGPHGRQYRLATENDLRAVDAAKQALVERCKSPNTNLLPLIPHEPVPPKSAHRAVGSQLPLYGFKSWGDLFTSRQKLSLLIFQEKVHAAHQTILQSSDQNLARPLLLLLALAVDRQADYSSSLCRWVTGGEFTAATLGGEKKLPMLSDFSEVNPVSGAAGSWSRQIDWIARFLERESGIIDRTGSIVQCSADEVVLPSDSVDALITDPPYYDSVPYSDLSNFYYVWLKRTLAGSSDQQVYDLAPKDREATVDHPGDVDETLGYQDILASTFAITSEATRPGGIGLVVFAQTATSAWEALLEGIIRGGWLVSASWPIDTERGNRMNALGTASLNSSVHIICRPRKNTEGSSRESIGEWRDILSELPQRVRDWMPRLAAEGVVGADAIFACLGPALEIFSRYSRVEKGSGEAVTLREYLEHVWAAVSNEALSMIFKDADAASLEPDARLTAMWLWTLGAGRLDSAPNGNGQDAEDEDNDDEDIEASASKVARDSGFTLEFDAARKIAQGLGVHLEKSQTIAEIKGDKARLLPVAERTRYLFGKGAATDGAGESGSRGRGRQKKPQQQSLFAELEAAEAAAEGSALGLGADQGPQPGATVLDRVHQAMLLFAAGRGEALKRFLVEDGIGQEARFWKLAQSLSALYPPGTDEKRWVDGVLARKKGLGL